MTRTELLQNIAITSGIAGLKEFEACEDINDIPRFLEWYKKDISFDSEEGKIVGQKIIDFLSQKTS